MAFSPFDPVDEERSLNDLEKNKQSIEQLKATVNKDVADRVSKIYRDNPYIPASVVLAMAKNGMSDEAIQAVQKSAALTTAKQLNPNKPKKQSWFERNVYGNFKAATRWGFAALQLAPDLVQNVAAEAFSPNDPEGMDGWFKSTNLGSLMANSDQAGTGFFVGGEVAKSQAERAREFRGTINGHAWTVGRGAASLVFTPGSVPYSVLSGFADAAVQFVDPTIVGGKVAAGVRAGRAAVPVLAGAEAIAGARKLSLVGETGLEAAESIAFNASKFGQWVTTNKAALRLTDNIVSVAKSTDSRPAKIQKVLELFDYSVSPDVAAAFADADDVVKVRGILGDASARLSGSPDDVLIPRDVRQIPGAKGAYGVSKYAIFDKAREKVPLYRNIRNSRYLAEVPKQNVIINGSGLDKTQAIKSFSDYFQGIGVGKDTAEYRSIMDKVVTSFTAGGDPGASRAAIQTAYDDALQLIFEKAGLQKESKEAIRAAIQRAKDELAKSRVFNLNELGEVDDGGFIKMIWEDLPGVVKEKFTPDQWDRLVLTGPGALAQLADDLLILPDFRQMRRLSGSMNFATTVQKGVRAGEARGPLVLAEFIQNEIWKPITLATGGYIMRNMIDAQTRIAMTGLSGFFNHPRDYIMWASKKKGFADIRGEEFERVIKSTAAEWDIESNKFAEAMNFDVNRNLEDTRLARSRNLKNNNFAIVDSVADPNAHTIGYVDNMGQIFGDQINQFLAKLQAMGLPEAERQRIVKDWLMSPEGAESRKTATRYLKNGVKVTDPQTGFQSIIPIDIADDNVVAAWVDKLSTSKINTIVRGDRDLAVVAGYNKVPVMFTDGAGNTRVVARTDQFFDDIDPTDILEGSGEAGTIIRLADGNEGLVLSRQADETGRAVVTVQPVYPKEAFPADRLGSSQLRRLIDSKRQQGKLAKKVTKAERGVPVDGDVGRKALEAKDFFVDKFFNGLYGTLTRNLEKSPLFRQAYYREVGLTAEALAPDQARQLLDNISVWAKQAGTTPAKFVGDKKVLDNLAKQAGSVSDATGTIDDLDGYAKAVALRFVKDTLYNATSRNNLEDILRVVIPFGGAWKEVLGTYASAVLEDPSRIRRAQLVFDGARKFDPDGNGEGFFYRDATTGEYSFNFPASGWITELLTGTEAPLQAPVKRVSIGLGVVPAIGPMAQIAYSKLAPDTPSLDAITKVLLPYGRKEGLGLTPLWVQRMTQAFEGNTLNLETVFGNTYIETLRAVSTSGEYDLKDPNEQERLYADVRQKARVLTALRALGQFFGPTSPAPEFKIETEAGDMYASQLVKEFQKLQAENYDTAVSRFLETYGNDAILYISNKTESLVGGLEATEEFGDWERGPGKNLLRRYPDVAAYMAPGGYDFSFEVWQRQIRGGKRRRLTDQELVDLAQYRAASAQYRTLREKLPPNPSDEQKAWLRQWRVQLNKEYPGFPAVAEFNPGEFPGKIAEMKRMVQDPVLADNDVAQALKQYLDARDKAVGNYVQAGGAESGFATALRAAPLRDWLANIGRVLKEQTPEFARIYDRILANEVDA